MRHALPALLALSLLAVVSSGCSSSGGGTSSSSGSGGGTSTGTNASTGTHGASSSGSHGSSSTGTHGGNIGGSIGGSTVTSSSASSSGSSGSTGDVDVDAGPVDAGPIPLGDGGFVDSCGVGTSRPVGGTCAGECQHGFHCGAAGTCVLNGGNGPLQVTLRFDQPEDLDLHVIEPGGCEVYYGNRTCVGALDLDTNAGCSVDNVDIENVIYPDPDGGAAPPSGQYQVNVDFYDNCDQTQSVPFEIEVRHNGIVDLYCGGFGSIAAPGGAGAGIPAATFTYP